MPTMVCHRLCCKRICDSVHAPLSEEKLLLPNFHGSTTYKVLHTTTPGYITNFLYCKQRKLTSYCFCSHCWFAHQISSLEFLLKELSIVLHTLTVFTKSYFEPMNCTSLEWQKYTVARNKSWSRIPESLILDGRPGFIFTLASQVVYQGFYFCPALSM